MAAKTEKITIGFEGAALSLRVSPETLDALLEKLPGGGWADVEADDGTARVDLGSVLYVRTERSEHKVGFGI
ncbi:MAG TPA: hypothetical protein VHB30_07260 [Solirubrobacteraceae bacterium]|jgi:hypothetical protein|nr:hypothetical protein [Solirubrobacteraceae bacterium]